jgi:hypothetical protein
MYSRTNAERRADSRSKIVHNIALGKRFLRASLLLALHRVLRMPNGSILGMFIRSTGEPHGFYFRNFE